MDSRLLDVAENPARGRENPTALLDLLDDGDDADRIGAAWAVCRVAAAHPDTVEYFVSRLDDRLGDGRRPAVSAALTYLLSAYPERGPATLETGDGSDRTAAATAGTPTIHVAGGDAAAPGGAARVVTGDEGEPEAVPTTETDDGPDGEDADDEDADAVDGRAVPRAVERVLSASGFDAFDQLVPLDGARYADAYGGIARSGGRETNVVVKRFPADGGRVPSATLDDFAAAAEAWAAVDDEHVLALHDWGRHPDPWLIVEYGAETFLDVAPVPADAGLAMAARLARGVSVLHQRGVLHGGIEPRNTAVVSASMDGGPTPKLTNVGITAPLAGADALPTPRDPRYAAPEWFDGEYSDLDAATDVYGIGALTYALVTGRHPYDGDAEAIRDAVLGGSPPPPTDVEPSLPDEIDDVIATAMATRKLLRYGSVDRLANELAALAG